ncbi:unnamed protein product [Rangifer tarandus platyrhynchus]|uniref:Uncharacterized protein n=1 Tax=Rangifer tarandus platyrhynchus TaxID=3082113 RepID=A0AC59YTS9_RANTA
MAVANFLVLLFKGIPQMIFIWGMTNILGNRGSPQVPDAPPDPRLLPASQLTFRALFLPEKMLT